MWKRQRQNKSRSDKAKCENIVGILTPALGQGQLLKGNDGHKEEYGKGTGRRGSVFREEGTECAKA